MAEHRPETAVRPRWDEARREQLRRQLQTTPAQRMAWLEEAIVIAHASGALGRHRQQLPPQAPAR